MTTARKGGGAHATGEGARDRLASGLTFWSLFLFGLFLLFVALWVPAEQKYQAMCAQENSLRREIRRLRAGNREAKTCLTAIRTDRYYIEKILREQQGLAREGELVVRSRLQVLPGE